MTSIIVDLVGAAAPKPLASGSCPGCQKTSSNACLPAGIKFVSHENDQVPRASASSAGLRSCTEPTFDRFSVGVGSGAGVDATTGVDVGTDVAVGVTVGVGVAVATVAVGVGLGVLVAVAEGVAVGSAVLVAVVV